MSVRLKMLQKLAEEAAKPETNEVPAPVATPPQPIATTINKALADIPEDRKSFADLIANGQVPPDCLMTYWNAIYRSASENATNKSIDFIVEIYKIHPQIIKVDWKKIFTDLMDTKKTESISYLERKLFDNDIYFSFDASQREIYNAQVANTTANFTNLQSKKEQVEFLKKHKLPEKLVSDFFWHVEDLYEDVSPKDLEEIYERQGSNFRYASAVPLQFFYLAHNAEYLNLYHKYPHPDLEKIIYESLALPDRFRILTNFFKSEIDRQFVERLINMNLRERNITKFIRLFDLFKSFGTRSELYLDFIVKNRYIDQSQILNLMTQEELNEICQEIFNRDYDNALIIDLYEMSNTNKDILTKGLIASKEYYTALELLVNKVLKNSFDTVILQKFIESSGDHIIIGKMLNSSNARENALNFAQGKKRFNDIRNKNLDAIQEDIKRLQSQPMVMTILEAQSFLDEVIAKKDWYYLNSNIIDNLFNETNFIREYLRAKNKKGRDIYHELKNDNNLYLKLRNIISEMDYDFNMTAGSGLGQFIQTSINFAQFIKYLDRAFDASRFKHNFSLPIETCIAIAMNPSLDPKDPSVKEFFQTYVELANEEKQNQMLAAAQEIANSKAGILNLEDFQRNIQVFKNFQDKFHNNQSISVSKGSLEYEAIKNLNTQINLINNFEAVKEYIEQAKPKEKDLFRLNWTHPQGFEFSVLKDMDPYAFQVGADTECCQRIGGAGEDAAIDSFINPTAGVLLCKHEGALMAQSYFHWVPSEKGIILDNVEINSRNLQRLGLDETILSKIYSDFATAIKAKYPDVAYVKCGLGYNKLNNNMFEKARMEDDPRHFESEDHYSDFDETDHLNLLAPSDQLSHVVIPEIKKRAEIVVPLLKLAMVRRIYFGLIRKA